MEQRASSGFAGEAFLLDDARNGYPLMRFDFMTREIWEALIIGVIIIGLALTAVRLYTDFTRPVDTDTFDDDLSKRNERQ